MTTIHVLKPVGGVEVARFVQEGTRYFFEVVNTETERYTKRINLGQDFEEAKLDFACEVYAYEMSQVGA